MQNPFTIRSLLKLEDARVVFLELGGFPLEIALLFLRVVLLSIFVSSFAIWGPQTPLNLLQRGHAQHRTLHNALFTRNLRFLSTVYNLMA